jgi:hypothetical protein
MKFTDFLNEVKLGKQYYDFKLNKDISEDVIEVEDKKYISTCKRMSKLANRLESFNISGLSQFVEDFKSLGKNYKLVENKLMNESAISKSEARMQLMGFKKTLNNLTSKLANKFLLKEIKEKEAIQTLGECVGIMFFTCAPLNEIGEVANVLTLSESYIPLEVKTYLFKEVETLERLLS